MDRESLRHLPVAAILGLALGLAGARAEASPWGFAAETGWITAAADGSPFVFRITPAKMLSDEFSVDGSFYLTPAGDAGMYSGAFVAQYHIRLKNGGISPFLGLGVAHRTSDSDGDTAFLFPIGSSFEVPIGNELSFMGTVSINIHDIELDGEEDAVSAGLTFGINYMP
jgi:hypothetical protein